MKKWGGRIAGTEILKLRSLKFFFFFGIGFSILQNVSFQRKKEETSKRVIKIILPFQ